MDLPPAVAGVLPQFRRLGLPAGYEPATNLPKVEARLWFLVRQHGAFVKSATVQQQA
jgi:hypothetical protein